MLTLPRCGSCVFGTLNPGYLDLEGMQHHSPKPIITAIKASISHTFGILQSFRAYVGFRFKSGLGFKVYLGFRVYRLHGLGFGDLKGCKGSLINNTSANEGILGSLPANVFSSAEASRVTFNSIPFHKKKIDPKSQTPSSATRAPKSGIY